MSVETTGFVVMFDVALVMALSLAFARLLGRVRQPPVIGEILAGIALGPSLLGLLGGDLPHVLFPEEARAYLNVVAQLGLVLFMFGVGFESDVGQMKRMGRRAGVLSAGSILVPAAVGVLVAIPLWSAHRIVDGEEVPLAAFASFVAIALSVTAFPVLARILSDAGLLRDRIGTLAMTIAAGTDLVAWSALAVVVGIYGDGGHGSIVQLVVLSVGYAVVLVAVVRPLLRTVLARLGRDAAPGAAVAGVLLVGLLLSSAATGAIGLHPAIGAFAFGVACPRVGAAAAPTATGARSLQHAGLLFVPVFFLTTGLSVDLTQLSGSGFTALLVLLLAAFGAKFVGVAVAARLCRMGGREALALGALMNARGLTELVVLQVGRSAGILDEQMFTALVAVAVVTTVATGPIFRRIHPGASLSPVHARAPATSGLAARAPGHA